MFYRSVFLYDQFDRIKESALKPENYRLGKKIEELFVFREGEEEEIRKYKYVKFFEALAVILIVLKFIESDSSSPKTLDLLKFYWAEKLNLEIID